MPSGDKADRVMVEQYSLLRNLQRPGAASLLPSLTTVLGRGSYFSPQGMLQQFGFTCAKSVGPRKGGAFDRSRQHHLRPYVFKDGVYDPRKMVETFAYSK